MYTKNFPLYSLKCTPNVVFLYYSFKYSPHVAIMKLNVLYSNEFKWYIHVHYIAMYYKCKSGQIHEGVLSVKHLFSL